MYTSMGYGVYIFFASCLILASIYAYFFIHETKGLRMDQMDHLFGFDRAHEDMTVTGDKLGDEHGDEKDTHVSGHRTEVA